MILCFCCCCLYKGLVLEIITININITNYSIQKNLFIIINIEITKPIIIIIFIIIIEIIVIIFIITHRRFYNLFYYHVYNNQIHYHDKVSCYTFSIFYITLTNNLLVKISQVNLLVVTIFFKQNQFNSEPNKI